MATTARPSIDAPSAEPEEWEALDWPAVRREVRRLQVRIAKAVREKRYRKARSLQWLLTHSFAAKAWAVRRVTGNRGKNTPGVDGVVWRTPRQKMQAVRSLRRRGYRPQPLRRIYIPKSNGRRRPLGIPTFRDRAMQALYLWALNPVAETQADPNSYGFRIGRSAADALGQCFIALAKRHSPVWVLEGDIESCFDRIGHEWLLGHVLLDRSILHAWLKAGYLEGGTFHITEEGTPQGGIISPVLANLALDGLEEVARKAVPPRSKVNVIRYADDFLVTGCSRELLEERIRPAIAAFLAERGLRLSDEKTRITHIETGFDFLGANVRKYNGKLLIKPSKRNVRGFLRGVRDFLRSHRSIRTVELIRGLNRRIRGWAQAFRHLVSHDVFGYVDRCLFESLWRWVRRRHPRKPATWLRRKYFRCHGSQRWIFTALPRAREGAVRPLDLFRASSLRILRHVKVRAEATSFDPTSAAYFRERWLRRQRLAASTSRPEPVF